MIELIFQKELMLIKQIDQKNVSFVIIGIFQIKTLLMDHIFVMGVIMQKSTDFKNIAIVHVKKSAYRIYFLDMSKREAKKLMFNSNLIDKIGIYEW